MREERGGEGGGERRREAKRGEGRRREGKGVELYIIC